MKKSIPLILAAAVIFPMFARSQNSGSKVSSTQPTSTNVPMNDRSTQSMTMIDNPNKSGGGTGTYEVFNSMSMYLDPGWDKGYVVLSDNSVMDSIQLRYDIYHQQVQFIRQSDTLAFSKPEELRYLFIGSRKFIYTPYQKEGVVKSGYFEVLHEGSCPLYLHRMITYHKDPEDSPGLQTDVYVQECEYYVHKPGQIAQPIELSRKSILCVFNEKQREVDKFMDDNGLNGKSCQQLKQIIAFYDSLP